MKIRTSITHPLRIDFTNSGSAGYIGITLCPGKQQKSPMSGDDWGRDLDIDLLAIKNCETPNSRPISTIVTLIEDGRYNENEFENLRVENLGLKVEEYGFKWIWIPYPDGCLPTTEFIDEWSKKKGRLLDSLAAGENVLFHCKGGLGRACVVSAMLLYETGFTIQEAIEKLRDTRGVGAIGRHIAKGADISQGGWLWEVYR
jgi:protein-tyrosine phosphatase